MKRFVIPLVAALAVGGLGFAAYRAHRTPSMEVAAVAPLPAKSASGKGEASKGGAGAPVAVEVVRVAEVNLADDLSAVGTLGSNESVILRPEVSGRIAQIAFREGQPVRKGQLLIQLDASVNQAEVQQARAELDLARNNLKRTEELAEKNFVSPRARDESQSNVQVLEAKLKLAEARLSKMRILAPFDGIAGIRHVSVGDYVKDGADLVNVEDVRSLKLDFRLPERFQPRVAKGQRVEVTTDAQPDKPYAALIDAIDPLVDANGRSVAIRARMENPGDRLRPGMFARVRVIVGERKAALLVPEEAIVPQGGELYVYRVVDGKAVRTLVRTGLRREAKVQVIEGLRAGEQVVVSGQMKLQRDGMPVRILEAAKPAADAVKA
jgi:membrane fusion protein (multidrug efflux system)